MRIGGAKSKVQRAWGIETDKKADDRGHIQVSGVSGWEAYPSFNL
jgi:hypothetical protein